ncbi:MAG: 5-(carboxyamino)imidazole ribonucleotide synthase [Xanthomonadales bacterium]|nr:5-(carboxyamino)imidazole ribonucleotide synthase [Xanthomonadales bacterium]
MNRVGVLGGGQLGRMMAQAGRPLGISCLFLDPAADACAGDEGDLLVAGWEDSVALDRLSEHCDVATFDFENVPRASAQRVARRIPFRPCPEALAACQDRLVEKRLLRDLDIDTPDVHPVSSRPDLLEALDHIGLPAVLKTRRFGYDGKGQAVLRNDEDLERAWQRLGGHELILEAFVPFDLETSIIAVRGLDGEVRSWPMGRNLHRGGVLAATLVPALDDAIQADAEARVRRLLEHFDYVGVIALELFLVGDRLLANEIAPRVHNSGHWSIDGAETSQFDNHLRAITGRPLGDTAARHHSLMFNWIGRHPRPVSLPGVHWHDYRKKARPGRKVGHATVVADDLPTLRDRAQDLADAVGGSAADTLERLIPANEAIGLL